MSVELAGLIVGIVGNVLALIAVWLRLRWKAIELRGHRRQMVELVQVLPLNSCVDTHHGPGGLRTRLTVGRAREHGDDRRA
ncbi:hypothetical protein [Nocardia sp. NPDC050793]|uniref:hypothetical protein n=1 Tax=Nocardia sp. NPDC050793 TaxID=3155159 RepID=UPI00340ECA52